MVAVPSATVHVDMVCSPRTQAHFDALSAFARASDELVRAQAEMMDLGAVRLRTSWWQWKSRQIVRAALRRAASRISELIEAREVARKQLSDSIAAIVQSGKVSSS